MTDPAVDLRFLPPPIPPRHLTRSRLLDALDSAVDEVPFTLIAAGPGAGKTVLLAEWYRHLDRARAWLALTPSDNEPRRFWALMLAAVRASGVVDGAMPFPWPAGADGQLIDDLFGQVSALSARPLCLVLDDAHLVSHPAILDGLNQTVQHWGERIHLVVAARHDPLLPLHRYRLAGQLRELRAADLAMTRPEAHDVLAAHGVQLADQDLDRLLTRTEGWAAGLRLSAMRMEGSERPAEFVTEFALDQGSIGEYLIEEVLGRQSEQVRQLLIETAFLPEVTAQLAEAITGTEGCGEILAELARANSFVTPVDAARTRFRYHPMLREILEYLAGPHDGERVRRVFNRSAACFRQQGDLAAALEWAVRAGDADTVADLLLHGALAHVIAGGRPLAPLVRGQLLELGEHFGSDVAAGVARLAARALTAENGSARRIRGDWATAAACDTADLLAEQGLREIVWLAELVLADRAGEFDAADAAAARLLALGDRDAQPGLRAALLLLQGRARFCMGRLDDAEGLLDEALATASAAAQPAVYAEVLAWTGVLCAYEGRFRHCADALNRAGMLIAEAPDAAPPPALDVARGMCDFLRGDFLSAESAARATLEAGNGPAVVGLATLMRADVLVLQGRIIEARLLLDGLPAFDAQTAGLLAAWRDAALANMEIALGRPTAALRLLAPWRREPLAALVALPAARACLATGDTTEAARHVRSVLTATGRHVPRGVLIDAVLCEARLADDAGDTGRALELLARAGELAEDEIVLPFARNGPAFAELLARHPAAAAHWPAALPELAAAVPADDEPPLTRLPEPLTDRERAIVRLLATSMSAADIAEEMCLSINTVKTHLAGIYRKLSARKRQEAVQRARVLELL